MMRRVVPVYAALLLLAGAAPPPDRPLLAPDKDAVLGYHLNPAGGEAINVRVAYRAGGKSIRIDLPDTSFMLANTQMKSLELIVPLERTVVDLPWTDGPQTLFLLDPRTKFTRKGDATVAGQKCAVWDTMQEQARGTVCVTADGLVLRNQMPGPHGTHSTIEAFVVRYGGLAEADFNRPPGFETLQPQALPGR